jgi:uncharacterized protein YdhG (YjbR/CyaY superfamily)
MNEQVKAYIERCAPQRQPLLLTVREAILSCSDEFQECFSYNMPAYRYGGEVMVYFALAKSHLGFYPTPSGVIYYQSLGLPFPYSKGAIRIPFDAPELVETIKLITQYRIIQRKR